MSTRSVFRGWVLVLAVLPIPAVLAIHKDKGAEAEIEKLKGDVRRVNSEWVLRVRYKVETEHVMPEDHLEFVIRVSEGGQSLHGADGQPIEIVVPLEYPTSVNADDDGDEHEYKDSFTIRLPERSFKYVDEIELRGDVFSGNRPIACKNSSVKFVPVSYGWHYRGEISISVDP